MRDFSNTKVGHWTITSFHHKTTKGTFWNAKCDCGKEKVLRGDVIKQQRSDSCMSCSNRRRKERGLVMWNRIEDRGQVLINTEYSIYKSVAKRADREFNLSKKAFTVLITSNCHYCLDAPNRLLSDAFSETTMLAHGVDRIDSSIGYTVQNCVPCCLICNRMKNDLSTQAFKLHIAKINANLAKF